MRHIRTAFVPCRSIFPPQVVNHRAQRKVIHDPPIRILRHLLGMTIHLPRPSWAEHHRKRAARQQTLSETRIPRMRASENIQRSLGQIRGRSHQRKIKVVKPATRIRLPIKHDAINELFQRFRSQHLQTHTISIHHFLGQCFHPSRSPFPIARPHQLRHFKNLKRTQTEEPFHPGKDTPRPPAECSRRILFITPEDQIQIMR